MWHKYSVIGGGNKAGQGGFEGQVVESKGTKETAREQTSNVSDAETVSLAHLLRVCHNFRYVNSQGHAHVRAAPSALPFQGRSQTLFHSTLYARTHKHKFTDGHR